MTRGYLNLDIIEDIPEDIIFDMSNIIFNGPKEHEKRASFIYLRNANIKAELDFSDCTYEDKCEFLMLYLCSDIEVTADILSTTWIEILSAKDGGGVYLPSILTSDEIKSFREENIDFINEIYQFINSLPVYAMYSMNLDKHVYDTDEFKKTDWDKISMANFWKLSKYDPFIFLIDGSTESLFYEKLFIEKDYNMSKLMNGLPFYNMLSVLFAPAEIQDEAVDRINDLLTPPSREE